LGDPTDLVRGYAARFLQVFDTLLKVVRGVFQEFSFRKAERHRIVDLKSFADDAQGREQ